MSAKNRRETRHVLVTGFPNFTAIKFMQRIAVTERYSTLHLLVTEKAIPYVKNQIKLLPETARRRIRIYSGDVSFLDLGLSGQEVLSLTGKITHIYHLAAIWKLNVPRRICREVNIKGARNILDFAGECKNLKRLAYFSTIYISGDRKGVINEDEFYKGQKFKSNFEHTRFLGEKLVRERIESGLPVTIFRLGNVVGDSETGEFLRFEGPYLFIKLLLTLDKNLPFFLPGDCEGPTNLVPINYVLDACQHIMKTRRSIGETYHITDPYPLIARTIIDALCAYLGRKPPTYGVPRRLYKIVLLIPGMDRFAGMPKELFYYLNHKAIHNCAKTLEALKGSGITCPRFETYFPLSIEYAKLLHKRLLEEREAAEAIDPFDRQAP